MSIADKVKKFFHSIGIHSVTIQYECDSEQPTISNEVNNENLIDGDCLLRCENEECDTQTCCTKVADRTTILLNNNNAMQIFAISQSNENNNSLETRISITPSIQDQQL